MRNLTKKTLSYSLLFAIIVIAGFGVRIFNVEWDDGYYFHPDELHIYSVVTNIQPPDTWETFIGVDSPLNPRFFAYGSLPLYILKGAGWLFAFVEPSLANFSQLYLVGRPLSAFIDTLTIIVIYAISSLIGLPKYWRLTASAIYAFAVFPIQNAHFYTVDTQLTFWVASTLMLSLTALYKNRSWPLYLATVTTGLALSTKVTAIALIPIILISLIMLQATNRTSWSRFTFSVLSLGILLIGIITIVTIATQPYVVIDYQTFVRDITQQLRMREDAKIFPYTIQYLNTTPYVYPIVQIIQWGLGPLVGLLAFGGIGALLVTTVKGFGKRILHTDKLIILLCFFVLFIPLGSSAVKFMRYYLPLYPILSVTATYALYTLFKHIRLPFKIILGSVIVGSYMVWTGAFMTLYTVSHPWIQATEWMHASVPPNSVIAIEHWDRGLPIWGMSSYTVEELELYHPDSEAKIHTLARQLDQVDYIIIASNRLHTSIPKWPQRYPATIAYYDKLFSGDLGFEKIATFETYPEILGVRIIDARADESFTVYDHPQVLIFKKTTYDPLHATDMLLSHLAI